MSEQAGGSTDAGSRGKKRAVEEGVVDPHNNDAKKKKRLEDDAARGGKLIDMVRRSYLEDPANLAPIYEVWSFLLCTKTFAQCTTSGLRDPNDARVKALEFVQGIILKENENSVGRYLQNVVSTLSSLTQKNFSGDKGHMHIEIEVDMLTGTWIRRGDANDGLPKSEIMVFICKHTGKRLGSTGTGFTSSPDILVKDQNVCLMNLFRGHVAFLTTSTFFDTKKNNKRVNAEADIEHACQTVRAQIAKNIEACYDDAVDASNAALNVLNQQRAEIKLPENVGDKRRELDAAAARLDTHNAKLESLFGNDRDDNDEEDEDDESVKEANTKIKEEFQRLREAYFVKTNRLMESKQKAEEALQDAMISAKDTMEMIEALDARIEEHKRKYYYGDEAKKKDEMNPAEFGRIVDLLMEELTTNVVEKEYYDHFRDLLYLFDDAKILPALVQQLKLIISNDAIRTEACMAFVIGVNEHFRNATQ